MSALRIDLYSDTKTRPTAAMRQAIANAEVGDEQHNEDPTVTRLLERIAPLLGQEAAMFLPSGTMANEIAVLVHCRQGDEIISHETAHLFNFEGGAPAALAGAMVSKVSGPRGLYDRATLERAIRPDNRYLPRSRLVVVEQTANIGGGTVWPLEQMTAVVELAREHGLAVHMDGARLMNASVASGIEPARFAGLFDTVYLDFTKGLGAPVGAILAGRKTFIDAAWRWKQRLGGSMRQAGILAAACLHALDYHVDRLAEDHENAQLLARELAALDGITVEPVDTNIVFFDVSGSGLSAAEFNARLLPHGLRAGIHGPTRLRAVTHLDVSREAVLEAVGIVRNVLSAAKG